MTFTKRDTLLTILGCLCCVSLRSQELVQHPDLIKGRLDNGLTYYIYPNRMPEGEAVYRLFIKSGSVYETEEQRGLAHFLEHMAFNGTEHFPDDAMVRFLESKGAKFGKDLNAHTSYNETVYKLQLPTADPAVVDTTMTILADWAGGLLLDSLQIEKERGVIMSEWLSKTGPKQDAQQVLLNELLNNSRYSERKVIGDTAVIMNFPHREIRDYYETWYDPSLMAVAVVGDIDAAEIERMIADKFGRLASRDGRGAPRSYGIEPYDSAAVSTATHESLDAIELTAIQILPPLAGVDSEEDYLPYLQRVMLNRLMRARLSGLSFDDPPYGKASAGISDFLNTSSVLLSSVELVPGKVGKGIEAYFRNMEQIYRYGFIGLEIEKAREDYLSSLKRRAESQAPTPSSSLMDEVYGDFFKGHRIITPQEEYRLARKYIDQIDSVSLAGYLNSTVDWDRNHFVLSAFDSAKGELPSDTLLLSLAGGLRRADIPRFSKSVYVPEKLLAKRPRPGRIVKTEPIPEIGATRMELTNGATVIFKPSDLDKDKVTVSAFRRGGLYALDPADFVSGLFAGSIISLSGAGEFSREALSHYLTGNTASVRFLIDKTRSGIAGTSAGSDARTLFELLHLKWTQPRLDTAVYRQIKERAVESYLTANTTESERFQRDLGYLLQGRNYTNRELTDTLLNTELSSDSMLRIFDRSFGPAGGFTFIVAGDITLKEAKPLIKRYIASLPSGTQDTDYRFRRDYAALGDTLFVRHAGETPRATVSIVFQQDTVGGSMQMEGLKNDILKSVVRTKLLQSLREEMGMVYSVGVSASSALYPSPLSRQMIAFTTAPENVDALIARLDSELGRMASDPRSFERELADVKANLVKEMRINVQRTSFWSGYIRNTIFNGEADWSFVNDFERLVDSVTADDIAAVIAAKMAGGGPRVQAVLYPADKH